MPRRPGRSVRTCVVRINRQRRPASLDHEVADARSFAAWGIDYLKYDNCNNEHRPALERYKAMGLVFEC